MATIDDFVNHRWADAKEALRQLDPDYVSKVEDLAREYESKNRLLYIPLEAIPASDVKDNPRKPLSTEWHKLLESCNEMTIQADIIRTVAASLTPNQVGQERNDTAGRLFVYHFRSFPIHLKSMVERLHDVIGKTANTYLGDHKSIRKFRKRYKQTINQQMPDSLSKLRNASVHATNRNWAKKVTKENSWEPAVIGPTPRIALDASFYPQLGSRFKYGEYTHFVDEAEMFLHGLGKILQELEQDLMTKYKLKYRMGQRG